MKSNNSTELKRRLVVHAINLANFKTDLEKSEKIRLDFVAQGDGFQASLAEEVSNAHSKAIEHIKDLIVEDAKALAQTQTADDRTCS